MFRPLHRASTPALWGESVRKHAGSLELRGKGVVENIRVKRPLNWTNQRFERERMQLYLTTYEGQQILYGFHESPSAIVPVAS